MPAKSAPKKSGKAKKIVTKPTTKAEKSTASPFLFHWLHDVSLETGGPARAFSAGERQLDLLVRANHGTMSQSSHWRVELRLRANIHTADTLLALAEIKYVGVVEKIHSENELPALLAEIYPFARQALAGVLALAGHQAPLPDTLEVDKIKS